jgi:uncharacterized phiE125 gp8 family phage protein
MENYNLTLVTPPAIEPLSLQEVKPYLRLDDVSDTSDDIYISSLITVAREYCEEYQHRAYITQTWELAIQKFPIDETDTLNNDIRDSIIEIPKGSLQAINSFTYKDSAGVATVMNPDIDYVLSTRGILGRICPPFGKIFPVCLLYPLDPIVIQFTCGYGDDASKVPAIIKHAMLLLISHWYENRVVVGGSNGLSAGEVEFTVTSLLMKDRITIL